MCVYIKDGWRSLLKRIFLHTLLHSLTGVVGIYRLQLDQSSHLNLPAAVVKKAGKSVITQFALKQNRIKLKFVAKLIASSRVF